MFIDQRGIVVQLVDDGKVSCRKCVYYSGISTDPCNQAEYAPLNGVCAMKEHWEEVPNSDKA